MSAEEGKPFIQSQTYNATAPQPAVAPTAPVPMANMFFSDDPTTITCPYCKATTTTNVEHKVSAGSWICVAILALVCFPLAWLPCCCDSCQQADHSCANCNRKVGEKVFITS
ncbi:lipopolysaccharide-induced transcription factor regulating tumor necrosis factor alpha, putative [Perkinsus marinus ATCC 50983]|uniref:Lipopolysaccharide-induced transcription factor regulating tumor necrosis factor alpha, putative n=1 Tax=Perkinsus marinus (strain ATCC 50983 / TXsc) TaxID=423536 RepID=C5L090_PERM5|nr:lipopolysaccharide-induced transcription factor regulating tumor necrosis factor alpha, putative [Perkinsus marinus ATCC 50983]EER09948.1 lipopolysaccharide-induced transcription factor regulating tumor necrosis factor alpha, putative [Perkinsus marinus ATCC 50983]|eukprot:XP_002778153.1 lipopolysaccharide-induced transcription factor regulating tumor necrosis factor alpha, putative [Perkinsus marinus ATCC 50983]